MPRSVNQPGSESLHGILIIDKPLRRTSMDIVSMARRMAGGATTGHAGTLDPLATGVLVLAIGKATKQIERLMNTTKRYETVIDFSAFTTTDDLEGERTGVEVAHPPDVSTIRAVLSKTVGRSMQRPPAFSAKKINGTRAYQLARRGKEVCLEANEVVVHSMELTRYEWPLVEIHLHCDKGFYVRSLARDLGVALGTGGHCTSIRRTAVGPFTLDNARTMESLPAALSMSDLLPIDALPVLLAESPTPSRQSATVPAQPI